MSRPNTTPAPSAAHRHRLTRDGHRHRDIPQRCARLGLVDTRRIPFLKRIHRASPQACLKRSFLTAKRGPMGVHGSWWEQRQLGTAAQLHNRLFSPKRFDNVSSATCKIKPSSVPRYLSTQREENNPAITVPALKMSPTREVSLPAIISVFWGPLFHSLDKITSFADLLLQ